MLGPRSADPRTQELLQRAMGPQRNCGENIKEGGPVAFGGRGRQGA